MLGCCPFSLGRSGGASQLEQLDIAALQMFLADRLAQHAAQFQALDGQRHADLAEQVDDFLVVALGQHLGAMRAQGAEEFTQAGDALERAVDQLAGHVLELHAGDGGVDVAAHLAVQRLQQRPVFRRGRAAGQQQIDGLLLRADGVVDRHEIDRQLSIASSSSRPVWIRSVSTSVRCFLPWSETPDNRRFTWEPSIFFLVIKVSFSSNRAGAARDPLLLLPRSYPTVSASPRRPPHYYSRPAWRRRASRPVRSSCS